MEDGIAVKEEPMSEGDEDQVMEVEIKQEVLIWDEYVKEEVGNSRTDEDAGCPMIKQEDSSAADPLCDESDVQQGSTGVQRSEARPAPLDCRFCTFFVRFVVEVVLEGLLAVLGEPCAQYLFQEPLPFQIVVFGSKSEWPVKLECVAS
ncbi:hypothetical protein GE061_008720 [Apolygus lucorum]|uniref:Uncharacterized protein n=1 Tax=Apolygus lucorum TaxID=248454 RepID=A0A8S9WNC2_APOLU|nr:hypothetical protein GE061_008720 [Apolygus lucorum]